MRTLLAGEFATAIQTNPRADVYGKLEVQNASGTWKDLAVVMGHSVTISARWGETVDSPVSAATFVVAGIVHGVSLAPLIAASAANVDDASAYAPLLQIGRAIRFSTATMDPGVSLDGTKYREVFTGRIDEVEIADSPELFGPITLTCSDLGAWLMDCQVETSGVQYGTTPVGTALETVMQNIVDATIPVTEPRPTIVKSSTSTFAVTDYQLGAVKLMDALTGIVLDSTGEDFRYRYDAAHVSQAMWFNPDRNRVTVDQTFPADSYVLTKLSTAIANVRNYGRMPSPENSGFVTYEDTVSSAATRYRRRMFQLERSPFITTDAQALTVVTGAVNDLSDAPEEVSAALPYLWFVQLYDRYTFTENNRQFDSDQTYSVVGYQHVVEAGHASTTLTLTGRVVGAYRAWLTRLDTSLAATSGLSSVHAADSADGLSRTIGWTRGSSVAWVAVYLQTLRAPVTVDGFDFTGIAPLTLLPPGTDTYTLTLPVPGSQTFLILEPRLGDMSTGPDVRIAIGPPIPHEWQAVQSASEAAGVGTATLVLTDPGAVFDPTTPITFETLELGVSTTGQAPTTKPGSGTAGTYTFAVTLSPLHPIQVIAHGLFADGTTRTLASWTFDSDKTADVVNATVANNGANATITAVWDTDTLVGANCARYSTDGGSTWTTVTVGAGYLMQFAVARTNAKQTVLLQAKNAIDAGATWGNQSTVEVDGLEAALTVRARILTSDANTATVRVAVADPYPQGANSATITYTETGGTGTACSPVSGGTVTPDATLTEAAGTYVDYTITRPDYGTGTRRVTFTGTASGRVSGTDAVDVPAKERDTVPLQCKATRGTTTGNDIAYTVAVADPYPQASGTITVAATATGGCTVSPSSATINCTATTADIDTTGTASFTITRGSAPGRVTFKATNANRVMASDAADVEQAPYSLTLSLAVSVATGTGGAAGPPYTELDTSWTVSGMPTGVEYDVSYTISGGSTASAKGLTTTSHTFTGVTFNTFGGSAPGNGSVTVVAKLNGQVIASDTTNGLFGT